MGVVVTGLEADQGKVEDLEDIFSSPAAPSFLGKPWVAVECGPKSWSKIQYGWLIEDDSNQIQLIDWDGALQKLRKPASNEKRPEISEGPDGFIIWEALQKVDFSVAWQVEKEDYREKSKKFLADGFPEVKKGNGISRSVEERFDLADHIVDAARYSYYAYQLGQKAHAKDLYDHADQGYENYLKKYSVAVENPPENLRAFVVDPMASRSITRVIFAAHGGSPRDELLRAWEGIALIPDHQYRKEAQEMSRHYRNLLDEDANWSAPKPEEFARFTVDEKVSYWIYLLRDLDIGQWSDPGRCCVVGGFEARTRNDTPNPAKELKELGIAAVPQLIAHLDDARPTRCKGHWRSYWPEGHYLLRYGDCCQQIFESITGYAIYSGTNYPVRDGAGESCKIKAQKWWVEYQKSKRDPAGKLPVPLFEPDDE